MWVLLVQVEATAVGVGTAIPAVCRTWRDARATARQQGNTWNVRKMGRPRPHQTGRRALLEYDLVQCHSCFRVGHQGRREQPHDEEGPTSRHAISGGLCGPLTGGRRDWRGRAWIPDLRCTGLTSRAPWRRGPARPRSVRRVARAMPAFHYDPYFYLHAMVK